MELNTKPVTDDEIYEKLLSLKGSLKGKGKGYTDRELREMACKEYLEKRGVVLD